MSSRLDIRKHGRPYVRKIGTVDDKYSDATVCQFYAQVLLQITSEVNHELLLVASICTSGVYQSLGVQGNLVDNGYGAQWS